MKISGSIVVVALTLLGVLPLWAQTHNSRKTSVKVTGHTGRRSSSKASNAALKKWVYPTYGFSLALPGNWKAKTSADLHDFSYVVNNKQGKVRQSLTVQMGETETPNLKELAAEITKSGSGKIKTQELNLGGQQAINIITNTDPAHWAQQQILVSIHGKQAFALVLSGIAGENLDITRKQILGNWRWMPLAAPTSYLQLSPVRTPVAGGQLTLKLPPCIRATAVAAQASSFGIFDARTDTSALVLNVNLLPNAQALTLAQMRKKFSQRLKQSVKLPYPPLWQDKAAQGKTPSRTLCMPFEMKELANLTGQKTLVSYGIAKMAGNRWALFTFNITGQSPQNIKIYTALIQKIFDSVQLRPVQAKH